MDPLVAFSPGVGAFEVSMEGPNEEVGAAVMNAVRTMVEMTPSEFEVIVVKVEVALTKIQGQRLINLEASKLVVTHALVGPRGHVHGQEHTTACWDGCRRRASQEAFPCRWRISERCNDRPRGQCK